MQKEQIISLIKYTKNFDLLYIEDNLSIQENTKKGLGSIFRSIQTADNGKEAIEIFENNHFDMIITDIEMPEIDGLEFIKYIRKYNKHIPIIVFSAHNNTEYFLKTINNGVDGYILKPYSLEKITTVLSNIIEKYNLKKQNNIIYLENNFIWDKKKSKLYKNKTHIKLTKNETKLFELYINTNSSSKSYGEIEYHIFNSDDGNVKKMRNLISRLKLKTEYELFETIYSYGYSLKYEEKNEQ